MMFIRGASSAEPTRSRRGRGGTIADERRAFRYRQQDRAISRGLADRLGVLALGSAAQQVAAPTPRYRALMKSSRSKHAQSLVQQPEDRNIGPEWMARFGQWAGVTRKAAMLAEIILV
jgi:hypothetical protein